MWKKAAIGVGYVILGLIASCALLLVVTLPGIAEMINGIIDFGLFIAGLFVFWLFLQGVGTAMDTSLQGSNRLTKNRPEKKKRRPIRR